MKRKDGSSLDSQGQEKKRKVGVRVERSDRIKPIFDNQNLIKEWLLTGYVPKQATVWDIGVGKFGDMWKYKALDVKKVVGIDVNQEHLNEGARRLLESESKTFQQAVSFLRIDLTQPVDTFVKQVDQVLANGTADVVVANFSIHYFFGSRDIALGLFKYIAKKLKPGGHFIGTTVDGDKLLSLLGGGGGEKKFQDPLMQISLGESTGKNTYGRPVTMSIAESIIDQEHKSREFLVTPDLLKTTAHDAGLKMVNIWPFQWIEQTQKFRRPLHKLDEQQARVSHLYMAFVFSLLVVEP